MVRGFPERITAEMSRRVALALPLLELIASAGAQDWPTKPLRLLPKDSGARAE
jgi:hypothetical protein